ncbi:MAG: hypothetical protein B7Z44_07125 [Caulobacter sp. 12-67-6]|nr:MAG: hypothetical protein B7Z44_07125 [Caulobacter sp. 12-67-6]
MLSLTKDLESPPGQLDPSDKSGTSEEAWIVGSNPEQAIRMRSLSVYLSNGGALKDVRLVEGEDGVHNLIWSRARRTNGD